jgi:hypothetical protein
MRAFLPTMIEVEGGGHPLVRDRVGFGGRVSEAKLEALVRPAERGTEVQERINVLLCQPPVRADIQQKARS